MAILHVVGFVLVLGATLVCMFVLPARAASWLEQRFGSKKAAGAGDKFATPSLLSAAVFACGACLIYVTGFAAAAIVLTPGVPWGGIAYAAVWVLAVSSAAAAG